MTPCRKSASAGALDDGHEPQRRLLELDGGLGVRKLRAVDDLGPVDELAHRLGLPTELLGERTGNELGAALGLGIVELLAAVLGSRSGPGPRGSGSR